MKRQFGKTLQHIAALTLGVFLTLGPAAHAAFNTGTGDIAGVPGDLTDSVAFELTSSPTLALVKTAFLAGGGAALTSGDSLPAGTQVDFMIYLNNESDVAVLDVSIQDILDPLFLYTAGTIRVDNSVNECALTACDATEELAIYNAARVVGAGTDGAAAGDTVSFAALTVDVGDSVTAANDQQDAAANKVLAVVFTVTVQ